MPEKLVRLVAPAGTDECSLNETRYVVGPDRTVTVPFEAVDGLTRVGGFTLAPEQPLSPDDEIANEVAAALNSDPEV
jgi:hypothetical protein